MYVLRVASKANIADDPSRERYSLLKRLQVCNVAGARLPRACLRVVGACQAIEVEPVMDRRFLDAKSWISLSATAHRAWRSEVITVD
jgi:hypothetical protein